MLATVDDLVEYMGGIELTPDQRTHVTDVILPGVQQELEVHCNRPVEVVHIRETLVADDRGYIIFSKTPVWKINFIMNSQSGTMLELPTAPSPALPVFASSPGIDRNLDLVGTGPIMSLGFEFYVGRSIDAIGYVLGPYLGAAAQPVSYVADYEAGWKGTEEQGLVLSILRVAAREVERQFDDTMSIKGGTIDAAESSDPNYKYWSQDELYEWDRIRRRVVL